MSTSPVIETTDDFQTLILDNNDDDLSGKIQDMQSTTNSFHPMSPRNPKLGLTETSPRLSTIIQTPKKVTFNSQTPNSKTPNSKLDTSPRTPNSKTPNSKLDTSPRTPNSKSKLDTSPRTPNSKLDTSPRTPNSKTPNSRTPLKLETPSKTPRSKLDTTPRHASPIDLMESSPMALPTAISTSPILVQTPLAIRQEKRETPRKSKTPRILEEKVPEKEIQWVDPKTGHDVVLYRRARDTLPDYNSMDEHELTFAKEQLIQKYESLQKILGKDTVKIPDLDETDMAVAHYRFYAFTDLLRRRKFIQTKISRNKAGLIAFWGLLELGACWISGSSLAENYLDFQMSRLNNYQVCLYEIGEHQWETQGVKQKSDPMSDLYWSTGVSTGLFIVATLICYKTGGDVKGMYKQLNLVTCAVTGEEQVLPPGEEHKSGIFENFASFVSSSGILSTLGNMASNALSGGQQQAVPTRSIYSNFRAEQ